MALRPDRNNEKNQRPPRARAHSTAGRTTAASVINESGVPRQLLEIAAKGHDTCTELAADYLQLACAALAAPEAMLDDGAGQVWHWTTATGGLSSHDGLATASGPTVAVSRADTEGRLSFPGRGGLSAAEAEDAQLVAFAAGRALDQFTQQTYRLRRSALEREREEVLRQFISGASVPQVLDAIVALVDRHAPHCRAALLSIDGWAVECVAAPGLPPEYRLASSALHALPPASSDESMAAIRCAAAVHDRARHIEIASQLGFPWCASVPVLSRSGEMLGLFIAHSAEPPGRAIHEILRNVSRVASLVMDHRRLQMRAAWLAEHDALTGLDNGTGIIRAVRAAMAQAESGSTAAVLFISLDRFRSINAALGRTAGDLIIKRTAERIRSMLHDSDFIARYTGDEFVAVLVRRDAAAVLLAADEIRFEVPRPLPVEGQEVAVTCSIGVSIWPDGGSDAESLLRNAENATTPAREKGGGRIHTYAASRTAAMKPSRYLVERGLRNAAERNELELHYQPLVSIDGALTGFEVLLSWKHPEFGRVPATQFIPIAEEANLIVPIGEWVLRGVCRQAMAWRESTPDPLRFWVNVSARQFALPAFAGTVQSIISESGVEPAAITLELTETMIVRDMEESARLMTELGAGGVRLAIDDFGSGYSSLNYLRSFPVHAIKIDQSFMRDLSESPRALAVMDSIVGLGHTLGLEVVAEGVETETQFEILRRTGCDLAQGYLFGTAMPAAATEALIRKRGR